VVYHVGGGTLPNDSPFKLYLNFRNNLYLLFKNLAFTDLLYLLPMRLLFDGLAASMFMLKGKPKSFLSVLKAHLVFYGKLNKLVKKRRTKLPYLKLKTVNDVWYKRSIIIDYFVRKRHIYSDLIRN
jgi:hypothetical protein